MSNEIMIRMEQIVKTYYIGQPNELEILHGINLDVKRGEFISIVGECRRIRFRKKYSDEYYGYSGPSDFR